MKTTTEQPSCKLNLPRLFTQICTMLISTGQSRLLKSNVRIFTALLFFMSGIIFSNKSGAQCSSFGVDFSQGANRDNFGSYVTGELHWINGILNANNSRYIEGMSTMQRLIFNNLPACGSGNHVLRMKMESRKGDVHAYDFITSWDNAYKATQAIAP